MPIAATEDTLYSENALIFEHLGAPEKTFISFLGYDHMMVMETRMARRMGHFAVAFFGYHLQGNWDLKRYYSQEWVAQYEDLLWGAIPSD